MPATKETKNLYQRLLAITEEVGKIEKTGKNQQQGYAFTEYSQVAAEVRAQMAKHGVMIVPETVERRMAQITNSKGTTFTQANVSSRYTLINADNPEDRMVCEWDGGEALDTSDKATNKAITASAKNFYMKLFNISDKEDPDAHAHQIDQKQVMPPITVTEKTPAKQFTDAIQKLKAAFEEHGYTEPTSKVAFVKDVLGKPQPSTVEEYEQVIAKLKEVPF